jgi:mannan endo-1,4-beta-mannosidase
MKTQVPARAVVLLLLIFCTVGNNVSSQPSRNEQTECLYKHLKSLSGKKIMFGMANPTTLTYRKTINPDINKSDCKDITGSHPAFFESDLMWYSNPEIKKTDIEAMKAAFKRGCVCGYCWHLRGIESGSFYAKDGDRTLVHRIVSNPDRRTNPSLDWYLKKIDESVIPIFKELEFPVVFRPFHEMNGNWFWWGKRWCTTEEYRAIYRLTVDYLQKAGLRNILFAWSPDAISGLEFYPGDDYVDILGMDIYEPGIDPSKSTAKMLEGLGVLTDYADDHQKVAAMTECGCRKVKKVWRYPDLFPDFWTKYVLEPILNDKKARRIVWISSWNNADWNNDGTGQFYIPYKGLSTPKGIEATADFLKFYNHPVTLFEADLPDMYHDNNSDY